jgi:Domain of unknown function (DUF4234)
MAEEIELGKGGLGKIRSYWVGFALSIVTLTIYSLCWYYFVNDELKDIGIEKDDGNLAQSSPMMSVIALVVGGWLFVPTILSVYNYGQRIRRAQLLCGIDRNRAINPTLSLLLLFPGGLLIVPYFIHFWYVTKHQNAALRAAVGRDPWGEAAVPSIS